MPHYFSFKDFDIHISTSLHKGKVANICLSPWRNLRAAIRIDCVFLLLELKCQQLGGGEEDFNYICFLFFSGCDLFASKWNQQFHLLWWCDGDLFFFWYSVSSIHVLWSDTDQTHCCDNINISPLLSKSTKLLDSRWGIWALIGCEVRASAMVTLGLASVLARCYLFSPKALFTVRDAQMSGLSVMAVSESGPMHARLSIFPYRPTRILSSFTRISVWTLFFFFFKSNVPFEYLTTFKFLFVTFFALF